MMNWSDKWRELVLRSSFRKGRSPFTIGEFVEWYDLQLEHNNYPRVLLDKVQRHLDKHSTVLDIGAGTGAFALPLARLVRAVTVVEPSAEMLTRLCRNMDTTNIRIINKRWEDVDLEEIGQHDLVLAAKEHFCFIIRVGRQDFYADIWRHFKGEESIPRPASFTSTMSSINWEYRRYGHHTNSPQSGLFGHRAGSKTLDGSA
jgi:SAM-dependent methyltransferase